jgi:NADH-quinone oxidoreductase subunit E
LAVNVIAEEGRGVSETENINLSAEAEKQVAELIAKYPSAQSAIIPALHIAQEELGWVDERAVRWVAQRVGVPAVHVRSLASFYTMFHLTPVGKYHIQVCRTLSCALSGARHIKEHLERRLGIGPGEVSADGMWSIEEVECLGSCGTAPVVEINDVYFEKLTAEKLDQILDRIIKERPNLSFSTRYQELDTGLSDLPRSEAWNIRG